jgi:hypothetical protein
MTNESVRISCGYAKQYKAIKAPTCGCFKCEAKWKSAWRVEQVVDLIPVSTDADLVPDFVVKKIGIHTPEYWVEAIRELAEVYHRQRQQTEDDKYHEN